MARRWVNELDFRADLWVDVCRYGGRALKEALLALASGKPEELPCRPALWRHSRAMWLSEVQLDLVWLHWLVCVRKCPTAAAPEAPNRADKLRALLRQALFPHVDEGEDLTLAYCCSRERRAQWTSLFEGKKPEERAHILPFSLLMRGALELLEQPKEDEKQKQKTERVAPYDAELARAATTARLKRQNDPLGHWVEESVCQFGIACDFVDAGPEDRIALLRTVLQSDAV